MTSTPMTPTTISIVIPLSGSLSLLPNCLTDPSASIGEGFTRVETKNEGETMVMDLELESKPEDKDSTTVTVTREPNKQQQLRPDKTKGCPFPTCSRYGRAFSRAHDLKRHIARHESRKERLVESNRGDVRICCQCGESFFNDTILERHARSAHHSAFSAGIKQHENEFRPVAFMPLSLLSSGHQQSLGESSQSLITLYSCNVCQKKCTSEDSHHLTIVKDQKPENNVMCQFCSCQFDNNEKLQNHMREEHNATSIIQMHESLNRAKIKSKQGKKKLDGNDGGSENDNNDGDDDNNGYDENNDNDDELMLEGMLLLNKNPRFVHSSSGNNTDVSTSAICSAVSVTSSSSSTTTTTTTTPIAKNNNNKIRCDYCSKTFKTKWTLSSHVAAHEGRFQFGCTRCGKKFVRKSHFEGHVRSHEAARPYVCEQCGKTFKELKHRREHTKRKHPDNQSAIQNLLDSISACVSEDSSVDQAKFTLLMPMNFGT